MVKIIQPSMAGGEVSPPVGARVDLAKRSVSVELADNFQSTFTGSMESRSGQKFVARCKPSAGPHRILEFEFNTSQTYVIELGDQYMRFHTNGLQILDSADVQAVDGATQANPVVITSIGHAFTDGDEIYISGVDGMTELNGRNFIVRNVVGDDYEIQTLNSVNVDGTGYGAFTGVGIAVPPYEVVTPWAAADLFDIKYAQSGDVMTLVHPDYSPRELIRVDNDTWSLSQIDLTPTVPHPTGCTHIENTARSTGTITAISKASTARVTDSSHGLATGDIISITDVVGMVEINNFNYFVTVINANEFDLAYNFNGLAVNSTGFTTYTSGGTWEKFVRPRSYTVTAISADDNEESLRSTDGYTVAITNITQANPAVVTFAGGHGFEDNDTLEINGIVGMTELNGRRFAAEFVDATTIILKFLDNSDVNSTSLTAYTSGGAADRLQTNAYSSAQADWDNKITWDLVTGADTYVIYASDNGGVFGKIGSSSKGSFQDDGIVPDYTQTPAISRDPFLDLDNAGNKNPSTTGFFQQRRIFANSNNNPNRFWMSQLGHFDNFSAARPPLSDDAITATIAARRINAIEHIVPLSELVFLTSGGEYRVQAGEGLIISPTTISVSPQSYYGSTKVRPIVAGEVALYISAGEFVRDLGYQIDSNKFVGRDLTILARHLFDRNTIVDWDYAPAPNSLGFLVMDDGTGLFLTYQPDQDVYAWTRASTKGKYKSTCVVREGAVDVTYAAVERIVDGFTAVFIERFDERQYETLSDAFCVDAGLTLDNPITITGITQADPMVITAPSHGLTDGDTVDISDVLSDDATTNQGTSLSSEYNGTGFVVANATANTFSVQIEAADYDSTAFSPYASGGNARKAVTAVSGMWHLEGETVVVTANSYVERNLTVTNGSITLQSPASRIHIGLPYFARLKTLPMSTYGAGGESTEGKSKNITRLTVQVDRSLGMWTGPSIDEMREARFGLPALYGQPLEMLTENIDVTLKANWGKKKQVVIEQRDPLPLTVLALIPDAIIGGN